MAERKILLLFVPTDMHCQVARPLPGLTKLQKRAKQESSVDAWDPQQGYESAVRTRVF